MSDYETARHHMIESQVRPNRVSDPAIVAALARVPRERFVPESLRGIAYVDEDIPLGHGRHLMEPMVLGRLLQTVEPSALDIALVVGAATGYSAAVLADVCNTVVALESEPDFVVEATRNLTELGVDNAAVIEGPLEAGFASQGPYDVILFDGAVGLVPDVILDQLAEDGRLVAVIDDGSGPVGRGTLMYRVQGSVARRVVFDASIRPLPGFRAEKGFVFET